MADESFDEATSSNQVINESLEATVEINIKTLDSRSFSFRVNKNIQVPLLKEKIADTVGVPAGQQRLIFKGKVLKDDHLLSEYHVEDGDTLHLVARQPVQTQTQSRTSSGETTGMDDNRGSDSAARAPRNRVGQVAHGVVLGTINVGDQTEVIMPDLSRIVGAVLNSLGIGTPTTIGGAGNVSSTDAPNASSQAPQSVERDGAQNASGRSQMGNQPPFSPFSLPFQPLNQSQQFPSMGTRLHHLAVPDSLATLSMFVSRLEQELSLNGYQSSSPSNVQDSARSDMPSSNLSGLQTPEVLATVVERVQRLLSDQTATALSHIAGRLGREASSTDTAVRGQIQSQAMHIGVAMQHLGALLLELGRTILMLRMGQSPTESMVNAGPAVYISASGPNPMMVQPVLHTVPLLGISSASPYTNVGVPGPVSIGDALRNVSIHIHAGTPVGAGGAATGSTTNAGEGTHGERSDQGPADINGNGLGNSGPMRRLPSRTVVAAIPARSSAEAASHVLNVIYPVHVRSQQPNSSPSVSAQGSVPTAENGPQSNEGGATLQPPSESESISTIVGQINAQIASALAGNVQGQSSFPPTLQSTDGLRTREGSHPVTSGSSCLSNADKDDSSQQPENMAAERTNRTVSDSLLQHISETGILGSEKEQIQPDNLESSTNKDTGGRLSRQEVPKMSLIKDSMICKAKDSTVGFSTHESGSGQKGKLLEAEKPVPLGLGLGGLQHKRRSKQLKSQGKDNVSCEAPPSGHDQQSIARGQQVLQSLVTQNSDIKWANTGGLAGLGPATGSGSTQQAGQSPDLGAMLLGSGRGQSGFDLSRMFQEMIPVLSQALGAGPSHPAASHGEELEPPCNNHETARDLTCNDKTSQIDLQQVVERIEHQDSPPNVFHYMLESAGQLYGDGSNLRNLVDVLGNDTELANEFLEMLRRYSYQQDRSD